MAGLNYLKRRKAHVALGALGVLTTFIAIGCAPDDPTTVDDTMKDIKANDTETDAGAPDPKGSPDRPTNDAGLDEADCTGLGDGTECGDASICIEERCTQSRCGDGFVDERVGEQCEDLNDQSGDGCSLCYFDCSDDADCDDGLECNGEETCNAESHMCERGEPAAAMSACSMETGGEGQCREGLCVAPGCGNGAPDPGEECDDGNSDDADGCTTECRYTCTTDEHCDNGNDCDGIERCDRINFTCEPGEPVTCNENGCSGTCNPEDGSCRYPDGDGDGSSCADDCNDADPAMFPGGYECLDGKDNDCDAATTEKGAPDCQCYYDKDRDGFAVSTSGSIASGGSCPDQYTHTYPGEGAIDCGPNTAAAYPGQTEYFPTEYCPGLTLCKFGQGSFDYNCDGKETSLLVDNKLAADTCASNTQEFWCTFSSGWVTSVPSCGGKGTYRSCSWNKKLGTCSGSDIANRVKPCH